MSRHDANLVMYGVLLSTKAAHQGAAEQEVRRLEELEKTLIEEAKAARQ